MEVLAGSTERYLISGRENLVKLPFLKYQFKTL